MVAGSTLAGITRTPDLIPTVQFLEISPWILDLRASEAAPLIRGFSMTAADQFTITESLTQGHKIHGLWK